VALHAAEEESIEAIKKWWDENGTMLIGLVAAVALSWGGWTFWQNSRISTIDAASNTYEEILALVQPGLELPVEDRTVIFQAADTLKAEHPDSAYALYAAMFAAQQAVTASDLDRAEQELQWVLDNIQDGLFNKTDEGLVLTTNLRLGRIILSKGDAQRALDLIDGLNPQSFEADFAELRGDIYVAQGLTVDARDAYNTALQAGSTSSFIQMKLDELANDG
jgi:predicted negative regulator of RcsB-dependent stress response